MVIIFNKYYNYYNITIFHYIGTEWSKNILVHTLQPTEINRQNYTAAIYCIWAKLRDFYLKDVDILPLQGLSWQIGFISILCSLTVICNIL